MNAITQFRRLYPDASDGQVAVTAQVWFAARRELVRIRAMLARHNVTVLYRDGYTNMTVAGRARRLNKRIYSVSDLETCIHFAAEFTCIKGPLTLEHLSYLSGIIT
jgi:hypothetical protein